MLRSDSALRSASQSKELLRRVVQDQQDFLLVQNYPVRPAEGKFCYPKIQILKRWT